ncbi:hypothetical protein BJ508DRAFT_359296 [Ascobolus immersus RN42]|uniref:Uncharacterized protein n=1 Tax=Ascobolus immersus RN42 TaxID=1160509 RepID=A0A3N4IH02_ASCIM|nr:hypothetical protein BJ508DRAFT_359296 [Ascobolus immersus RN42]
MHFSTIFFASLLSVVLASPLSDTSLNKRGYPGNVFVCSGPKYTNSCQILPVGTSGNCVKLPYNSLGSAGPDKGTICRIYESQCTGNFLAIAVYPGVANLYVSPLNGDDLGNRAKWIACTACKGDGNCQG